MWTYLLRNDAVSAMSVQSQHLHHPRVRNCKVTVLTLLKMLELVAPPTKRPKLSHMVMQSRMLMLHCLLLRLQHSDYKVLGASVLRDVTALACTQLPNSAVLYCSAVIALLCPVFARWMFPPTSTRHCRCAFW